VISMVESSAFQDVVRKSVANNEVRVFAGAGNPSLDLLPLCEWLCENLSRLCENLSRLCEGENDRMENRDGQYPKLWLNFIPFKT
jgi:hypothetical protein